MVRLLITAAAVLLTFAAVLALNSIFVDIQTRPAEARSGGTLMETDIVTANVKAEGEGPPVVLIHGFGAALDWWDEIVPDLARTHRVIRLDLIGHGGTEAPGSGYGIERQASLVEKVLDQLDIARAVVVGHSMGGEVATAFTEANPERVERLVLIDTPPTPERSFNLGTQLAFRRLIGQGLWRVRTDEMLRHALAHGFAPGFPVPDRFIAGLRQLTYKAFHDAHEESVAYVAARSTPDRLAALETGPPVLVIFGTHDALIPPESAQRFAAVPGLRLAMIDGAGHSPMVETPSRTLDLIRDFID